MFAQAHPIWDLVTNLAAVLGYLVPIVVLTWIVRGVLETYRLNMELMKVSILEVKNDLSDMKKSLEDYAVTSSARQKKLEEQFQAIYMAKRLK